MLTLSAASVCTFCIIVGVLFQFALIVGMPWGALAMAGKYPGRLPPQMRVAAFVQVLILTFLATTVLVRAGMFLPQWFGLSRSLIWIVVAFCGVSVVLNVITPSKWERRIWAPVAVMMLVSSLIVALD